MVEPFASRREAGSALAEALSRLDLPQGALLLALPRGGVPVAAEIARELDLPLDVFIVRKLGAPGQPELAIGAIASGGVRVLNPDLVASFGLAPGEVDRIARSELAELERRETAYREGRPAPAVAGRTVILVDDGLATGATMKAAIEAVRQLGAGPIIVAVPVAAPETLDEFAREFPGVTLVVLRTPDPFYAVGLWYRSFPPVSDEEVRALLREAAARRAAS
ncbi:phosphoribosyltransferase [Tepidiforma sp.]|uniref:phosphoribosyltransferase n=1 Tax=Tepidiforma sp. TaxID=2682230 RepID=UPI002ADE7B64|nr:phosphoribosyltransferase [Tepidiforma sp.]